MPSIKNQARIVLGDPDSLSLPLLSPFSLLLSCMLGGCGVRVVVVLLPETREREKGPER
jgi:hypothetical protein